MARTVKLFISHSWSYSDAYDRLCELLDARPYFLYENYSIPRDSPVHTSGSDDALVQAIQQRMAPCDVVVILAGKYATFSRWINGEIQVAKQGFYVPKPIVDVRPWAASQVSTVVRDSCHSLVGWNTEPVVGAIQQLAS
jgi:hypothetical protein